MSAAPTWVVSARYPDYILEAASPKVREALEADEAARPDLLRRLTEGDMRGCGRLLYPGIVAMVEQARAHDPYVWIDPWGRS